MQAIDRILCFGWEYSSFDERFGCWFKPFPRTLVDKWICGFAHAKVGTDAAIMWARTEWVTNLSAMLRSFQPYLQVHDGYGLADCIEIQVQLGCPSRPEATLSGIPTWSENHLISQMRLMVGRLFQNWWWPHCARSELHRAITVIHRGITSIHCAINCTHCGMNCKHLAIKHCAINCTHREVTGLLHAKQCRISAARHAITEFHRAMNCTHRLKTAVKSPDITVSSRDELHTSCENCSHVPL